MITELCTPDSHATNHHHRLSTEHQEGGKSGLAKSVGRYTASDTSRSKTPKRVYGILNASRDGHKPLIRKFASPGPWSVSEM